MILAGLTVGLFTASAGYLYGVWLNKRMDIPFRESRSPLRNSKHSPPRILRNSPRSSHLTPIALPVLLIAGGTLIGHTNAPDTLKRLMSILGDKNIALAIAAGLAIWTLASRVKDAKKLSEQMQGALQSRPDHPHLLRRRCLWQHPAADRHWPASTIKWDRMSMPSGSCLAFILTTVIQPPKVPPPWP